MVKDIIITIESFLLLVITLWAVAFTVMAADLVKERNMIYEKRSEDNFKQWCINYNK